MGKLRREKNLTASAVGTGVAAGGCSSPARAEGRLSAANVCAEPGPPGATQRRGNRPRERSRLPQRVHTRVLDQSRRVAYHNTGRVGQGSSISWIDAAARSNIAVGGSTAGWLGRGNRGRCCHRFLLVCADNLCWCIAVSVHRSVNAPFPGVASHAQCKRDHQSVALDGAGGQAVAAQCRTGRTVALAATAVATRSKPSRRAPAASTALSPSGR